jgi:TusA-related sulfurtransferase
MVHQLDNRGTSCALGLLKVRQVLSEVPLGDVVEVQTRDKFAQYEVPAWVERAGLELTFQKRSGFWLFCTYNFGIRKTKAVTAPKASVRL